MLRTERLDLPSKRCRRRCWAKKYLSQRPYQVPVYQTLTPRSRRSPGLPPYQPLKPWQTRMLRLLPSDNNQPLIANLLVVDLVCVKGVVLNATSENVKYDALSYSWGDGKLSHTLKLNGSEFAISQAVFSALHHIRYPDKVRYLWVDMLCINQDDLEEKGAQIRMMLTIFNKARRAIAWLGEQTQSGFDAIDYLKESQWKFAHAPDCLSGLQKMQTDLQDVFNRPWFRRTWVRQEVFAARELVVQCGEKTITWGQLKGGEERLEYIYRQLSAGGIMVDPSGPARFPTLRHLNQASQEAKGLSSEPVPKCEEALVRSKTPTEYAVDLVTVALPSYLFEASNPRDLIYGILGMTNTVTEPQESTSQGLVEHLSVNYNRSVSEVFQDAARYIIHRDKCLDVLYLANHSGGGENLPSWTPDWRSLRSLDKVMKHLDSMRDSLWKIEERRKVLAPRRSNSNILHPPSEYFFAAGEGGLLQVRGSLLTVISSDKPPDRYRQHDTYIIKEVYGSQTGGWKCAISTYPKYDEWIVPERTRRGDLIYRLDGSLYEVILRRTKVKDRYTWIGPSFKMNIICTGQPTYIYYRIMRKGSDFLWLV